MRVGWLVLILGIIFLAGLGVLLVTYHLTGTVSVDAVLGHGAVRQVHDPEGSVEVFFCGRDNCTQVLLPIIQPGVRCALYDVSKQEILDALINANADVVIDDENLDTQTQTIPGVRIDRKGSLMHDKFCVLGDQVITGSHNPTKNANQDQMIMIRSQAIAQNYNQEFDELWAGTHGKGSRVPYPKVRVGEILVENYFCPEDDCEEHTADLLKSANQTIDVMAFSFTSNVIGPILIQKHQSGVAIRSITDKTQLTEFSEDFALNRSGIPVKIYERRKGNNLLHHKVFIVDNAIVLGGSTNPTFSGYHKNDENMVIIHSPQVAEQFTQEFERIWGES